MILKRFVTLATIHIEGTTPSKITNAYRAKFGLPLQLYNQSRFFSDMLSNFDISRGSIKHRIVLEVSTSFGRDKFRIMVDGNMIQQDDLHLIVSLLLPTAPTYIIAKGDYVPLRLRN